MDHRYCDLRDRKCEMLQSFRNAESASAPNGGKRNENGDSSPSKLNSYGRGIRAYNMKPTICEKTKKEIFSVTRITSTPPPKS